MKAVLGLETLIMIGCYREVCLKEESDPKRYRHDGEEERRSKEIN
jgi:hypothetical protein